MKPTKITLSGTLQKNRAIELLNTVELNGKWTFSLSNKKLSRTDQQRKYYFMIVGIVAQELGYEKDELHNTYLETKYLPLFAMRDEPGKYARLYDMVKKCRQRGDMEAVAILLDAITSNDATKEENAQVIDSVIRQAAECSIQLPAPEQRGLLLNAV